MALPGSIADAMFQDLCRQRQSDLDRALQESARTGFETPIIFRRVHWKACGSLFNCASWLPVQVQPDPKNKHVYILPPVPTSWILNKATVPAIIKLEKLEHDTADNVELIKIAPFMAEDADDSDIVKILVTASTLVEDGDSEKEPLSAYKHDNLVLRISRCFFEEKDTDSVGCLNLGLFRWLSRRQSGGYIKI